MTRRSTHLTAAVAVLAGAAGVAQAAPTAREPGPAVAVAPAGDAAAVAAARGYAARHPGTALRLPRTAGEQLGVLHVLAARRTPMVLAFALDRRAAVEPVARAYPGLDLRLR
jgi:hypothetical protein